MQKMYGKLYAGRLRAILVYSSEPDLELKKQPTLHTQCALNIN